MVWLSWVRLGVVCVCVCGVLFEFGAAGLILVLLVACVLLVGLGC